MIKKKENFPILILACPYFSDDLQYYKLFRMYAQVVYNLISIAALSQISMNLLYRFTLVTFKQGQYKMVWSKFWLFYNFS